MVIFRLERLALDRFVTVDFGIYLFAHARLVSQRLDELIDLDALGLCLRTGLLTQASAYVRGL